MQTEREVDMANWWDNIQIKKGPGGCGNGYFLLNTNRVKQALEMRRHHKGLESQHSLDR